MAMCVFFLAMGCHQGGSLNQLTESAVFLEVMVERCRVLTGGVRKCCLTLTAADTKHSRNELNI